MQVLPQALLTVQIWQQDWAAGGVERWDGLTLRDGNGLLCVWSCVNRLSSEVGAVWTGRWRSWLARERRPGRRGSAACVHSVRFLFECVIRGSETMFIELCRSSGDGGHILVDGRSA